MKYAIAIFITTLAASVILEIGIVNWSYAQVVTAPNSMCEPNDKHVNATESRECGIPKTPSLSSAANSTTSTAGTTTAPSENTTIPQGAIPGLFS
jgi:hypothetical protein